MTIDQRNRDLSILIVDDDVSILNLIKKILIHSNPRYYIETATSVDSAISLATATYWDTILLDISLPLKENGVPSPEHGLYALDYLNKELKISAPIIAMTGYNDSELLEQALDRGAYYFLSKPLLAKPLAAIVKNAAKFQLSGFDGLTGLLNRVTFEERLKAEFERIKRNNKFTLGPSPDKKTISKEASFLSLIFIDADDFKQINDTYDHLTGDLVLKSISSAFKDESIYFPEPDQKTEQNTIIKYFIRPYDIAARFGGDEFALFLPETDQQGAISVAKRIRGILKNVNLKEITGDKNKHFIRNGIQLSIGIATYPEPNFIQNYEELILLADQAMYKSKENKKGEIFGYGPQGNIILLG